MSKKAIAAGAAAVIAAAAAIVKPWEGIETQVYADIVGVPTVCYGHTGKDVLLGQPKRTMAECNRLLVAVSPRAAHGSPLPSVGGDLSRGLPMHHDFEAVA